MNPSPVVLIVGTVDTKSDEIAFLRAQVERQGARAIVMDVGVLGRGGLTPEIANTEVAAAAGVTLQQIIDSGDENSSMTLMAQGAAALATRLHARGRFDGLLALGGTMGTDLALDVANALPLGCPKVILSTIAYSHLLPPERIAPDLMMRLWAGGLYGLNRVCRSALAQAAGAAVGACRATNVDTEVDGDTEGDARPVVGMTSLGSSALAYMKRLKPALEARGYELAVFHTTGMGGRAFEDLAAKRLFCAVMDFSLQELVNHLGGSCVTSGPDRLRGAGRAGVPQIVAPGATDMFDYATWAPRPSGYDGRADHAHNRLIASVLMTPAQRRAAAREIGARLGEAAGPTCLLLPTGGIEAWDRPGEPLHDPEGLTALVDELRVSVRPPVRLVEIAAHINDAAFCDAALAVFDDWVAQGLVPRGMPSSEAAR
ncbi:MAG: Tm-1-like ATP-binding domain-containing protein [Burkholderiales bacterium]|nr:Tm-1-like ATP-binding domain-containing protein [Burkholderiales bacterium]